MRAAPGNQPLAGAFSLSGGLARPRLGSALVQALSGLFALGLL